VAPKVRQLIADLERTGFQRVPGGKGFASKVSTSGFLRFGNSSGKDGDDESQTYAQLCELVREQIKELQSAGKELPPPATRPMRELAGV
jgi:hypothetical protein